MSIFSSDIRCVNYTNICIMHTKLWCFESLIVFNLFDLLSMCNISKYCFRFYPILGENIASRLQIVSLLAVTCDVYYINQIEQATCSAQKRTSGKNVAFIFTLGKYKETNTAFSCALSRMQIKH